MDLLDLIFEKRCYGCHKNGYYLCPSCEEKLYKSAQICAYCQKENRGGWTHKWCLEDKGLKRIISLFRYRGVLRKLILGIKYRFLADAQKDLARIVLNRLVAYKFPKSAVFVPIPLYWRRKNWRGFNQSEDLVKMLVSRLGIKQDLQVLSRTLASRPQTGLGRDERLRNIRGKFAVNKDKIEPKATYILVDDVWTTGATVKEACAEFKKAGASEVWALTIAR